MSDIPPEVFQGTDNFDFEFTNMAGDLGETEEALRNEAANRLLDLAKGHTDLTGAAVALEREMKDEQTGYLIRARVVVYTRPDYIAGIEKDDNPMGALKGALSKVERQVREKRDMLRESERQPKDIKKLAEELPPKEPPEEIDGRYT